MEPNKRIYVLACNHFQFWWFRNKLVERGFRRGDVVYLQSPEKLRGLRDMEVYRLGDWFLNALYTAEFRWLLRERYENAGLKIIDVEEADYT